MLLVLMGNKLSELHSLHTLTVQGMGGGKWITMRDYREQVLEAETGDSSEKELKKKSPGSLIKEAGEYLGSCF